MSDLPTEIRKYVREELRGVYTVLFAIVESVDSQNQRCTVSIKNDVDVILDNVPIASTYAADGSGVVTPLSVDDEGLLLVSKDPYEDMLSERGHTDVPIHRQHSFQDAVFFPQIWFKTDEVPAHDEGDYLVSHESGTIFTIKANGEVLIQHLSGNVIHMDADGRTTIGDPAAAESVAVQEHTHETTLADGTPRNSSTPNEPGTDTLID